DSLSPPPLAPTPPPPGDRPPAPALTLAGIGRFVSAAGGVGLAGPGWFFSAPGAAPAGDARSERPLAASGQPPEGGAPSPPPGAPAPVDRPAQAGNPLADVLPFDAAALERGMGVFLQQFERLASAAGTPRGGPSPLPWLAAALFALALEAARRRVRPPGPGDPFAPAPADVSSPWPAGWSAFSLDEDRNCLPLWKSSWPCSAAGPPPPPRRRPGSSSPSSARWSAATSRPGSAPGSTRKTSCSRCGSPCSRGFARRGGGSPTPTTCGPS